MSTTLALPPHGNQPLYGISAVERETGLSKDTLRVWERRYGFPQPDLGQWNDTMQIAAAVNLPLGLGALGSTIGAKVRKDMLGKKVMLEVSRVRQGPTGWIWPILSPELLSRIADYCEQDVHAMLDCWYRLPTLPIEEHRLMRVDRRINDRGALIDLSLAAAMVR